MKLTNREVAVILSALRMVQGDVEVLNSMPQMEEVDAVDEQYINNLCEKVNTEE